MDKKIKQRCVGALVLIIIAAISVPLVFRNSSIKTDKTIALRLIPVPPAKPQVMEMVQHDQQAAARQRTIISKEQLAADRKQALSYFQMPSTERLWYLQLASFSDRLHANKLASTLFKDKLKSKIIKINQLHDNKKTTIYRVVLGPFPIKSMAEKELMKVKKITGLNGLIILAKN